MRKLLLVCLAVTLGLVGRAQAACGRTTTCFTAVDVASNTYVGGLLNATNNLAVDGSLRVTGATTFSGAATLSGATTLSSMLTLNKGVASSTATFTNATAAVEISSAATSSAKVCLGGAFAALPTTGFNAGCLIVLTTDKKLYISTETVSGTYSWTSVGGQ